MSYVEYVHQYLGSFIFAESVHCRRSQGACSVNHQDQTSSGIIVVVVVIIIIIIINNTVNIVNINKP